ncbi:MAG: SRPBCC family protein [Cryomorphaceae bacterium]|nr:SRPBCC family protein [Cryomorphaceae bacterium]
MQSTQKIAVSARIHATSNIVWDCYTLPKHITKWNSPSDDWICPRASNDLRVGGKYFARMEAKDGSMGFDLEGIYDEIIHEEKLLFTLTDGRKIEVEFTKYEDGTNVVITFDAETQNPIEMQRNGWNTILNNFKVYTESTLY